MTGPSRKPDSSTQVVPVISPLPLSEYHPANTGSKKLRFPRGRTAVTPVRTGPSPTFSFPEPEMSVVNPTSTPLTSVIAFNGPGVPSKGTPRSRARGLDWLRATLVKRIMRKETLHSRENRMMIPNDEPYRNLQFPLQFGGPAPDILPPAANFGSGQ